MSLSSQSTAAEDPQSEARVDDAVNLQSLLHLHSDEVTMLLETGQLRVQLWLLSLIKITVCSLLMVLMGVSAWLLMLASLLSVAVYFGMPGTVGIGLCCVFTLFATWLSWRMLVRSVRQLSVSAAVAGERNAAAATTARRNAARGGANGQ